MALTVFSFDEISAVLYHPAMGSFQFVGNGVDSITINQAQDRYSDTSSADATISRSTNLSQNGTFVISVVPNSQNHKTLLEYEKRMKMLGVKEEQKTELTLDDRMLGQVDQYVGCALQRSPSRAYNAMGQNIEYVFLFAQRK